MLTDNLFLFGAVVVSILIFIIAYIAWFDEEWEDEELDEEE